MNSKSSIPWPLEAIGNVANINPRIDRSTLPASEELVSFVPMASVCENTGSIKEKIKRPLHEVTKGYTSFRQNDVLFAKITPCMENGKVALAADLEQGLGFGSTEFHVLRACESILPSYLWYFMRNPDFRIAMKAKMVGAGGQHRVPADAISAFEIPLPPLPEQHRIVEILDQADALRRQRREADAISQKILPALFQEMFGDLKNPKFAVQELEKVCVRVTDGTHQSPQWENDGIPFLMISNIVNFRLTFKTNKYISESTYLELTKRCPIEIGDVLYSTVGSFGNAALVTTEKRFCFQRHIAHIKPKQEQILPIFLWAMMNSPFVRDQAESKARGNAQRTVNLSDLKLFRVIVPPLTMQKQFVAQATIALAATSHQSTFADTLETLFQTLLHRAYDGSLTASWREGQARETLQEMELQTKK